jgi:hypothetical protein
MFVAIPWAIHFLLARRRGSDALACYRHLGGLRPRRLGWSSPRAWRVGSAT